MACSLGFLVLTIAVVFELLPVRADQEKMEVSVGDDVMLCCSAPTVSLSENTGVYWTRADLPNEDYVMFHSDGHSALNRQALPFRGRVQLADPELKNNNLSLVIRNASLNDTGLYHCKVIQGGPSYRDPPHVPPIRTIELLVTDRTDQGAEPDADYRALVVALPVSGVVLMLLVGLFFGFRHCSGGDRSDTDTQMSSIP